MSLNEELGTLYAACNRPRLRRRMCCALCRLAWGPRPSGKYSGSCTCYSLAGVGQGQGVFGSRPSQSTAQSEMLPMGYVHYSNRPQTINTATFNAIGEDLLALLPALEAFGSPLADAYGREESEIGPEFIGFNEVACCGHATNQDIRAPGRQKDAHRQVSLPGSRERCLIAPAMGIVPMSRSGSSSAGRQKPTTGSLGASANSFSALRSHGHCFSRHYQASPQKDFRGTDG